MPGLEDLYREIILDHYRNPRNRGELAVPPAHRAEGFNPLCGDEVVVYLEVSDGTVTDVRIGGQGCSISTASASLMTEFLKGRSRDEALRTFDLFHDMITAAPVRLRFLVLNRSARDVFSGAPSPGVRRGACGV